MSKIIKLGIVVAFVLAVLSVSTSLMLAVKQIKYREVAQKHDSELKESQALKAGMQKKMADYEKVVQEKEKIASQTAKMEEELNAVESELSELKKDLESKDEAIETLKQEKEAIASNTAASEELQIELERLKEQLHEAQASGSSQGGSELYQEKVKALVEELKQKDKLIAESRQRETELEEMAKTLKSQLSQLSSISQQKSSASYRAEAPVEVVNREMNFIVFSMGENDGVKVGDMLGVYRSGQFLGNIYVDEVFQNMASASISDELVKYNVNEGDIIRK
ncbi:MAG: hypothetical protein C4541_01245 [Candidatus Auribacter fodinae]|uniref:Uncharacterized protein n=1 Tax=Candidatus Auribacter fodinae TaxID=2093366 RepID=A0A3A4RAJ2_9BACT|nr:MAG: hypothetical protein C4541_01245 [Candidatus Auribacter fodinae]